MMIYTLFMYTVVAATGGNTFYDWRPIITVEPYVVAENTDDKMLTKCDSIARQLNIPKERYRCIRTK